MAVGAIVMRHLGRVDYGPTWQRMRDFTLSRTPETPDELWFLEHPPVYTLGLGASAAHLLDARGTPVEKTDRGGQITWHGPGQLVVYTLLDLRRRGLGPRELVRRLETGILAALARFGVAGTRRPGAPGVYVADAKIAALGLRIRNQCSYHGLSVNVDPDLSAFDGINPCGYAGLAVTSLARLGCRATPAEVAGVLAQTLPEAMEEDRPIAPAVSLSGQRRG